jgi:4-hydroxy-3-methylbut-2-enyl diphosphate reductase
MAAAAQRSPLRFSILAFDGRNRLAVSQSGSSIELPFSGSDLEAATSALDAAFPRHTRIFDAIETPAGNRFPLVQIVEDAAPSGVSFLSIDAVSSEKLSRSPELDAALQALEPRLADIPYLHLGEGDFIYKFRPAAGSDQSARPRDPGAEALYQSRLCAAVKTVARQKERTAGPPRELDFGPIRYVVPSHFGFCLGVKNAIDRAYETLAENPGRRVFMLSELIHNPFVNEDLRRRGLRYLQTDRGIPFTTDDRPSDEAPGAPLLWDDLSGDDIVVIPAFGATDEDKARLVRKGLPLFAHDATCMLVEKVWRAARAFGREGFTIIIHGKHEHEETKATFSNARRHAPAVIVRDLAEAKKLSEFIGVSDSASRERFAEAFAGRFTPGFDPARDLARVAVVNQTTLLMNETIAIIEHLRETYRDRLGDAGRVGGGRQRDTLCYATQVNQDALGRALAEPLDAAFVVGGRNSSNTWQLYRLCEQKLGRRAFFIPSEAAIRGPDSVEHTRYGSGPGAGTETRPLWPEGALATKPRRVLITGGASCPDGVLQQVINRLNGFFPGESLRPVEAVLADVAAGDPAGS